jgi:hypothetical protein
VEPRFEPVFAELNRHAAVLYLHPAGNSACSPLISDYNLTWIIGAPIEDTISIMQLITHGIPSRYPRIKIINSHDTWGAVRGNARLPEARDQYLSPAGWRPIGNLIASLGAPHLLCVDAPLVRLVCHGQAAEAGTEPAAA